MSQDKDTGVSEGAAWCILTDHLQTPYKCELLKKACVQEGEERKVDKQVEEKQKIRNILKCRTTQVTKSCLLR